MNGLDMCRRHHHLITPSCLFEEITIPLIWPHKHAHKLTLSRSETARDGNSNLFDSSVLTLSPTQCRRRRRRRICPLDDDDLNTKANATIRLRNAFAYHFWFYFCLWVSVRVCGMCGGLMLSKCFCRSLFDSLVFVVYISARMNSIFWIIYSFAGRPRERERERRVRLPEHFQFCAKDKWVLTTDAERTHTHAPYMRFGFSKIVHFPRNCVDKFVTQHFRSTQMTPLPFSSPGPGEDSAAGYARK